MAPTHSASTHGDTEPWWHPPRVTLNHGDTHPWCHLLTHCHLTAGCHQVPSAICSGDRASGTHGDTQPWWHPSIVTPTHCHLTAGCHKVPGAMGTERSAPAVPPPQCHPLVPPYHRMPPGPRHQRGAGRSGVPACPRCGPTPCPRGRSSRPGPGCPGDMQQRRWVPTHGTGTRGYTHTWVTH